MAVNTYVALDTVTVGTATPSITFSGFSSSYTDLILVANANASANSYTKLYFNSVTTSTYSATHLYGTGSGQGSARQVTGDAKGYIQCYYAYSASNRPTAQFHIQNYASSLYKTVLLRDDDAAYEVGMRAGLWASTSPITSITLERVSGNWAVGSTFSLYGVKAWANETSTKATGGYVYSDVNYWYHAFPFSSTFVPNQSITADILVVAGGGGGGAWNGGGGGAGGLLAFSSQSLTAQSYTVSVGAGGAGGTSVTNSTGTIGTNGGDSQFGALTTSVGGGGGGGHLSSTGPGSGATGGSGGGAADRGGSSAGNGTTSQGNAGGSSTDNDDTTDGAGGGGGAGAVGGNALSGQYGGAGGIGATSSLINAIGLATPFGRSSSGNIYFAGGGGGGAGTNINIGGGAGGLGGGGNGTQAANGGHAISNTGGGGGGAGGSNGGYPGGNGASGIVVIRYAKG